jgi:7-cyano-7-deazaguanine reductase
MVRQAPISFSVRKQPMHILVTGSTLHTLMQGEATYSGSPRWGSGGSVSDMAAQVSGLDGRFKDIEPAAQTEDNGFLIAREGQPMTDRYETLKNLGAASEIPASPDVAVLETVPNPHQDSDYLVRFTCPEFTSICPVTGQPDFAHIMIDYAPDETIVESKSLKLFLTSFRNHGAFHEDCTLMIGKRLVEAMEPKWLRIGGYWYPRGGIPIDVFWQTGKVPEGLWIPDQGVPSYRGRG